jgi:hypothetical protein
VDEKLDLSSLSKILDNLKQTTLRNKDYYKFVIGLSTGALLISVTFVDKFSLLPAYKAFTVIGWICLIISIITGVWLLPKHDSLETQWNTVIDLLSKAELVLWGIEQDVSKLVTRSLISGFLKEEMSKEPKDEEKIKALKREWLTPNGSKGKVFLKAMVSVVEKIYPSLATALPDITKELEKWEQLMNKGGKSIYPPYMLKKLRKTTNRVEVVQKAMTGFFYAGIILITLSSSVSFLGIDLIGMIRNLWNNVVSLALYPLR